MKIQEIYNYDNPKFTTLREPMRELIGAWGNAEKWFATLKEWPLIDMGMQHLSDVLHRLEHIQPERLDVWADAYRSWHLKLEYPPTPELAEVITDRDKLFEVSIAIIDEVNAALQKMIDATTGTEFHSLSIVTENIQIENIADKSKLLNIWALWSTGVNAASLETYIVSLEKGGCEQCR